ncbi:MAG TPA: S9 family peptidase, partial [Chryseobacterium sp.]
MKIKLTICLLAFLNFYEAQENITYQKPSAEILKLADYDRPPSVLTNSKKDWVIFTYRPTYKTLDDLNQQEMKLGGLRINPVTNISSSITYSNNLTVRKMNDKTEIQVKNLPVNPKITNTSFSPDEKKLAFTNTTDKGVELWVIDLETATAKKITKDNLNANLGNPYTWMKDSQSFLIKVLPENRGQLIDSSKDLPTGPIVSTADGKVSQNRTYQDLLKNPQDEKNFET